MKLKIERPLSALSAINNELTCYNLLNMIKENGDLFYSVFCPSNVITPRFSDGGSNKKIIEMNLLHKNLQKNQKSQYK